MIFEVLIIAFLFIFSFILIVKNWKLSVIVLLILSVLLHKEFFSVFRWDIMPIRIFMLAFCAFGAYKFIKSLIRGFSIDALEENFLNPFVFLLFCLWLSSGISIIFSKNIQASLFLYVFFTSIIILGIILYKYLYKDPDLALRYIKIYILIAFGLCVFSLIKLFVYLKFNFIFGALWNVPGHIPRLGATFWDVNHFASLLSGLLPVLGVLTLIKRKAILRISGVFIFILMMAILLLTNSRSAWIMAFVSFITFITIHLIRKYAYRGIIYIFFALLIAFLPIFSEYQNKSSPFRARVKQYFHYRIDSFESHFLLLRGAFEVFEKYPLFGGGYGSFFEHFSKTKVSAAYFSRDPAALNVRVPAHTLWGEALAETGIIGFTTLLLFALLVILTPLYGSFVIKDKDEVLLCSAMASSLIGWFFAGIFYSYKSEFFWIIIFLYFIYAVGVLKKEFSLEKLITFFIGNELIAKGVVFLVSFFLIFVSLGRNHLIPWDEAIYAEISKNILINKSFLVLQWILGKPWFEKPPLYMWIVSIFMKFLGINTWSIRLPSALFGICTVFLTYFFARKLYGRFVAFISAFIIATTFQFLYYSRVGMLDVTTTFFTTLCLYTYYLAHDKGSYTKYWVLSGLSLGLAVMTKGVIGLIPIFIILINELYLIFSKKLLLNRKIIRNYLIFIFVSLIVFMPWHIFMYQKFGSDFIKNYLGYHVFERAVSEIEDKGRPLFWYITVLKVSMRIWFVFLIPAFFYLLFLIFHDHKNDNRCKSIFTLIWSLFIFMFFSIARSKLVWYIMPIYPVLSIITAVFIAKLFYLFLKKIFIKKEYLFKFLFFYYLIFLSLMYLFLNKGLIYTSDLTGSQALMLQSKDQKFGVDKKFYADRIDLPLVLFYSDGPFEIVDFTPLKRKFDAAKYDENFIFITKESRFRKFSESFMYIRLVDFDNEWVLGYLPSQYEVDFQKLQEVNLSLEKIKSDVRALQQSNKEIPQSLYNHISYLESIRKLLSQKIDKNLNKN